MPEDDPFEEALRYAGDENRLLDGEDLESRESDDARHWESVYRELHSFKVEVLKRAEERGASVDEDGQPEIQNDLTILRAEARRLQHRHDYWQRRRLELEDLRGASRQ